MITRNASELSKVRNPKQMMLSAITNGGSSVFSDTKRSEYQHLSTRKSQIVAMFSRSQVQAKVPKAEEAREQPAIESNPIKSRFDVVKQADLQEQEEYDRQMLQSVRQALA